MNTLNFKPIRDNPNIVSKSVLQLVQSWKGKTDTSDLQCAPIDPAFTGSAEFCEQYGVDPADGANCIIVEIVRGSDRNFACCLVPIGARADLNGIVRKHFSARRISFAPLAQVEQETAMEYGSITPFGLPTTWPILIDSEIMKKEKIIIGGGKKISKLRIPTGAFLEIPNVKVIEGLGSKL